MGLEGPFGAPAQEYEKYEILLLVGAGIGITPFASILKEICYKFNHLRCPHHIKCPETGDVIPCPTVNFNLFPIKKVYFNFISRNQGEMTWFSDTLEQLEYDQKLFPDDDLDDDEKAKIEKRKKRGPLVEIHQHITAVDNETDVRSAAIKMVQKAAIKMHETEADKVAKGVRASQARQSHGGDPEEMAKALEMKKLRTEAEMEEERTLAGRDILTGMAANIPLHFGRANWDKIMPYIKKKSLEDDRFEDDAMKEYNGQMKELQAEHKAAFDKCSDTEEQEALAAKQQYEINDLTAMKPSKKPLKIGVFFCGAPVIGNMINIACDKYSDKANSDEDAFVKRKIEFVFHEEHF
jgi:hypothetical protein